MTDPGRTLPTGVSLICLTVSIILIKLLWQGIQALHPEYGYSGIGRERLNGNHNYAIVFLELEILTVSIMLVHRKDSTLDLAAGTYLIWFLATTPVAFHLQVTSYLVTWVLFFGSFAHRAASWSPCFFLDFLQFYYDDQ